MTPEELRLLAEWATSHAFYGWPQEVKDAAQKARAEADRMEALYARIEPKGEHKNHPLAKAHKE